MRVGLHAQHHHLRPRRRQYKSSVLPAGAARGREMGVTDGWWKYGCAAVVGIDTHGESAPRPCRSSTSVSPKRTWPMPCQATGAARLKPAKKAR